MNNDSELCPSEDAWTRRTWYFITNTYIRCKMQVLLREKQSRNRQIKERPFYTGTQKQQKFFKITWSITLTQDSILLIIYRIHEEMCVTWKSSLDYNGKICAFVWYRFIWISFWKINLYIQSWSVLGSPTFLMWTCEIRMCVGLGAK